MRILNCLTLCVLCFITGSITANENVAVTSDANSGLLYRQTEVTNLPSSSTGWDYIKFQPGTSRLYMARKADGLTIFDVSKMRAVKNVDNSIGANGPLLLPEMNRGYIAMTDGTLLSLELDTLEVLGRVKTAENIALNSGILDPYTGDMHFITGINKKEPRSHWYTLNPQTGELLKSKEFPFMKMDDPASDGQGNLYAPVLIDKLLLKLDAKTLEEKHRWSVGCLIAKVRYLEDVKRIIGACRGDNAQVFVFDPATGTKTAQVPIGDGIDGIAIDHKRKRIITSDGVAGNLSVIAMNGVDQLEYLGLVNTSVGSRMMDMDKRTGKLYVVSADFSKLVDKSTGELVRNYHPNTFKVQEFTPE